MSGGLDRKVNQALRAGHVPFANSIQKTLSTILTEGGTESASLGQKMLHDAVANMQLKDKFDKVLLTVMDPRSVVDFMPSPRWESRRAREHFGVQDRGMVSSDMDSKRRLRQSVAYAVHMLFEFGEQYPETIIFLAYGVIAWSFFMCCCWYIFLYLSW